MWRKEAITDGELDALRESAQRAWAADTAYPLWRGSRRHGGGQCFVTARWLTERLGGSVGVKAGHYVWLSPDGSHVIDLTGDHSGNVIYGSNKGYEPIEWVASERGDRLSKRANRIFNNLDDLLKVSADYAGDAYPGEEPQRADDIAQSNQFLHDEPTHEPQTAQYQFVYVNGQLEISPDHDHAELSQHAGIDHTHAGPIATGYVTLNGGEATWDVQSNVHAGAMARIFKEYSKQAGWKWGGLCNLEGEPISDEFAPKGGSLLSFIHADDHLYVSQTTHADLIVASGCKGGKDGGWIRISGDRAEVFPTPRSHTLASLFEWADDNCLTLYAGNDNVLKTIEDLELDNTGANKEEFDEPQVDERQPAGVYQCPGCNRLFPTWRDYQLHRRDDERWEEPEQHGDFPELDMDATHPPHFTEQQPFSMPVASWKEAARVPGFDGTPEGRYFVAYRDGQAVGYAWIHQGAIRQLKAPDDIAKWAILSKVVRYSDKPPKDMLEASMPFIYDIDQDSVTVGHPGSRTSDIPGKFTPGGILEGTYEPGGQVVIRSITNMPVSIHYLIKLWYHQHPELEVTGVSLQDDAGKETKLAADEGVGRFLAAQVAADPVADASSKALHRAGGKVFVVGGAVRDALVGKDPKDLDLMVTGLPSEEVQKILTALPGRVDYTGKDFGVFRYRHEGTEVEIALPRRERSTGVGHQDFDVQADHRMTPEEDLYRRDFTVNALAVDLSNGKLIDPYNGAQDIKDGRLRTLHDESLAEDPLRVVRALVANARHGFDPDDVTRGQLKASAGSLAHLPAERIQAELDKLFAAKNPAQAIRLAHDTGILKHLLPEVDAAFGYNQHNPHHELELGEHLVNVMDRISQKTDDPDMRLAALLHDIGKPGSRWDECVNCSEGLDNNRRRVMPRGVRQCPDCGGPVSGHYYEYRDQDGTHGAMHEDLGAEMARSRMDALRYPTDRIERVTKLIQHHMFPPFTQPRGARRFLNRVGDSADDLMTLRWADQGGKSEYPTDPTLSVDDHRNLVEQVRNEGQATNKSQLAINGNDLIQLGIPQGPQIGQVLQQLTEAVVDDPTLNERNKLLNMATENAKIQT